jgi:hypothetical protein
MKIENFGGKRENKDYAESRFLDQQRSVAC